MKKFYKQPQTENVRLDSGTIMQGIGEGSDATPGPVDAPVRRGTPAAILYI